MPTKPIRLKVASPCKADWNAMRGNDAVRHCGICDKNVYQLSNMTTAQVEALLSRAGESPCVRFYHRKDGTVMTSDCPVGVRRVRRQVAIAGLGFGMVAALGGAMAPRTTHPLMGAPTTQAPHQAETMPDGVDREPVDATMGEPIEVEMGEAEMGGVDPTYIMGAMRIIEPDALVPEQSASDSDARDPDHE